MRNTNAQKELKSIIEQMLKNKRLRIEITTGSHWIFFATYFARHVKYDSAPFHHEMFEITEDESIRTAVITAFRGSAKSTIFTLSYAIWTVLGKQEKKFVVILSQTHVKARQHFMNLKRELEGNELLRRDLGPFKEESDEWGSSLVLSKYDAKITFASSEQSIRGFRHGPNRPDLIIADDVEDNESVKTMEGRNKTYDWLTKDVIPAGDKHTRLFIIGTLLHEDSLLMRLRQEIQEGKRGGTYREYPLIDDEGNVLWKAKYPDQDAIDQERLQVGNERAWQQEYLLNIISDEDRVIQPEWLQYYDALPQDGFRFAATGIDLAISEKETADFTSMVSARVYGYGENLRIHILPNPVNKRIGFPETVNLAKILSRTLQNGIPTKLFVETVAYQKAMVDQLRHDGLPVEEAEVQGLDKRERLSLTAHLIQTGKVIFPNKGAEDLIRQLVGFGKERHDDLADAFAILILKIMAKDVKPFFSEWNTARHVVPERPITTDLRLFRVYIHGTETPAFCKWYALDHEGRVWVYRERSWTGKTIDEIAHEINYLSREEGYLFSLGDPSMFGDSGIVDRYGGQTIAEMFMRRGITFQRASDRRTDGWNAIRAYLRFTTLEPPKLFYFNICTESIRTIPELIPDEKNPDDVDRRGETRAADCDRYLLTILHERKTPLPLTDVEKKLLRIREGNRPKPWENAFYDF